MSKKVTVVIPTMGLWDKCTFPCLKSVIQPMAENTLQARNGHVKKNNYDDNDLEIDVVVVDNSINHETDNHKEDLAYIHVIRNEKNTGCSGAWNQGVRFAVARNSDFIMIINDDVLLNRDTIARLVKYLNDPMNDFTILASAMMVDHKSITQVRFPDEVFPELDEKTNEHPHFSAFMVRKDFFDIVGEFDEGFFPVYFEDNDMHRRILLAGKRAAMLEDAKFYHIDGGSVTQRSLNACPGERFVKLREYYVKKWGGQPGYEIFKTPFNDGNYTFKSTKQGSDPWPA